MNDGIKVIARNRKASHDYHLEETYQAGLVLTGSEIKSIRANRITLGDGFVEARDGELWLLNVHISPYDQAGTYGYVDPMRARKLLLHKREIAQIMSGISARGYTCVPTMVFLQKGRAKVEIALAKGKKQYDKRAAIAKRDSDRELRQAMKERYQDG
ncbi:MAG: SsrA-binding protein SmpB [Anaerolineae bacterium]